MAAAEGGPPESAHTPPSTFTLRDAFRPITVTDATLEPGAPVALFPTHIFGGGVNGTQGRQYDVPPDGRFLINTELDSATAPITLLQNWNPEAKT
jgi:hypothetical protein